ncbi:hypothetical protein D3C80_671650 [compost metagenome]
MGQLGQANGKHCLAKPRHEEAGDVQGRKHTAGDQFPVGLRGAPVDDFGWRGVEQHILFMTLGLLESHHALEGVAERLHDRIQGGVRVRNTFMQAANTPGEGHEPVLQAGGYRRLVAVGEVLVQVADIGLEPVAQFVVHGLLAGELLEGRGAVFRDVQRHGLMPFSLQGNEHNAGQLGFPQLEQAECHRRRGRWRLVKWCGESGGI